MTQFDLRGFAHPLGFRECGALPSAKNLDAITCNLTAFAANPREKKTSEKCPIYSAGSFEEKLAMAHQLAEDCAPPQREAIELIVLDIIKKNRIMRAAVAAGELKASAYLQPLETGNPWGDTVLALTEAFEISIPAEDAAEEDWTKLCECQGDMHEPSCFP